MSTLDIKARGHANTQPVLRWRFPEAAVAVYEAQNTYRGLENGAKSQRTVIASPAILGPLMPA